MSSQPPRPVGTLTRGTTGLQRLRRMDRWIASVHRSTIVQAKDPLVVDLGFGATGHTVVELAQWLTRVRDDIQVVGVEIDPQRVQKAQELARPGVSFRHGGFELGTVSDNPLIIRAFNVLRQYEEAEVEPAWALMQSRLAPGGLIIDGTCSESGRRSSWITIDADGPRALTISMKFSELHSPGSIAERLPKALIHRNVPGENIHRFLTELDELWRSHAALGTFGVRQRWIATCQAAKACGWPLLDGPSRWRLGELSVAYAAVSPGANPAKS